MQLRAIKEHLLDESIQRAVELYEKATSMDWPTAIDVSLSALKRRISSSKINGELLMNHSKLGIDLVELSTFSLASDPKTISDLNSMMKRAQDEFSFLPEQNEEELSESLYRSLDEFSHMEFESFAHNSKKSISTKFFTTELYLDSKATAISKMQEMDKGFYLARISQGSDMICIDKSYKATKYIVSNQESGVYFASFHISERAGYSLKKTTVFENPFFKNSRRYSEENSLVSIADKEHLALRYNDETLYAISFLCHLLVNQHWSVFDIESKNRLALFGCSDSKEVAIFNGKAEHVAEFSYEDVLFKGEYEHLSFLDERFGETLKKLMHLVNFSENLGEDRVAEMFYLSGEEAPKDPTEIQIGTLDYINNVSSVIGNSYLLKSIPKSSLGDFDSRERLLQYAISNKIAVYALLMSFYAHKKDRPLWTEEIESILAEQPDSVFPFIERLKNKAIASGKERLFIQYFGVSDKNKYRLNSDRCALYSTVPTQKQDILSLRSVNQKAKAHKFLRIGIENWDDLLLLIPESRLEDAKRKSNSIIRIMHAEHLSNLIAKEKGLKRYRSFEINFSRTEAELNRFMFAGIELHIPLSKREFDLLNNSEGIRLSEGY